MLFRCYLGPDDIPARFAWSTRSTGSSWVPWLHGEYSNIILLLLVSIQVDASVLMVHDVFQGLQGVPGPKVRLSALVLIHTEERTHLSHHGFVFYHRVNLDME